jgi:hypothetical protein
VIREVFWVIANIIIDGLQPQRATVLEAFGGVESMLQVKIIIIVVVIVVVIDSIVLVVVVCVNHFLIF